MKEAIKQRNVKSHSITYSQWITEYVKKKSRVILTKKTSDIFNFIDEVLLTSLSSSKLKFSEHLRKAWAQWDITKRPLIVTEGVAIRTREDYQEDLKFLCLSETVSTHRGVGVVTMVCYPAVVEIFHPDGKQELHGVIFMSNTKCKNFNTVNNFENRIINYVEELGYSVKRYDRISDGCSSQFWCWGTFQHLVNLTSRVPLVTFHRYERYEGKNMSDALGSLVKRKATSGALRQQVSGVDDLPSLLDDIDDDTSTEDLVFASHEQAFEWLKSIVEKNTTKFSEKFDRIELYWVPDDEIPKDVLDKKKTKKIPKIKSYNCVTATNQEAGFAYVKDSSCNSCNNCQRGELFKCTNTAKGHYSKYLIPKPARVARVDLLCESDSSSESESDSSDAEFDYGSNDEGWDDAIEEDLDMVFNTNPLSPGLFVLYKVEDRRFYVGCILEQLPHDRFLLKFARKFGSRNGQVTFIWPDNDHIDTLDSSVLQDMATPLPDPATTRRGSVIFPMNVFQKLPLTQLC